MKKYVVVDIDGTISKVGDRIKYLKTSPKDWDSFYKECYKDDPNYDMCELVSELYNSYDIVFCSGRRESCREDTEVWISKYLSPHISNCQILLRKDGDHRHDTEVKPELLRYSNVHPHNTAFILEDRDSMVKKWRLLGFTCLQVADGDF